MPIAKKFGVVDTETTGLGPNSRLAEIALIEVEYDENAGTLTIVDKFVQLVNPTVEFEAGASKVNGLSLAMLKNEPVFSDIAPEVRCWLLIKMPWLMYNANFDRRIIEAEFRRLGDQIPYLPDIVDVMYLAKKKIHKDCPDLDMVAREGSVRRSFSQGSVAKALGISIEGSHRAYQDVLILLKMYEQLMRMPDITGEENFEKAKPKTKKTVDTISVASDKNIVKTTKSQVTTVTDTKSVKTETTETKTETKTETVKTEKYDLTTHKTALVSGVAGLSLQKIVIDSVLSVRSILNDHNKTIEAGFDVVVFDDESSALAASLSASLTKIKSDTVKKRIGILGSLKKISSTVEEMYRDAVISRIENAITNIGNLRSAYIRQKFEQDKASVEIKKQAVENLAQSEGQKVFDDVKAKFDLETALSVSLNTYEGVNRDLKVKDVETTIKTELGNASVKDEIVFDIEILDASVVPAEFLSPDIAKISEYVNNLKGECSIAGVVITPRVKSRITNKRS